MEFTSLHTSSVPREQLRDVLSEYLALDHLRTFRRLLVVRCGALALVVALLETAVRGFSPAARVLSVALLLLPPCWVWLAELRREWRLGQRLGAVRRS